MFVTYPDVLQPGRGGLRAGWPLALLAASGAAVSHAIPSEHLACLYHFVPLSHSCSGIACEFGGEVHVRCVAGVRGECGCGGRGASGGLSGVWLGVRRGCGWGGPEGASGVWLWLGVAWGADLVRMTVPVSFWSLDGTEVLCFRRWKEVRGCIGDRIRIFLALLDALGVTPV